MIILRTNRFAKLRIYAELFLWSSGTLPRYNLITNHLEFFGSEVYWVIHEFLLLLMFALTIVPFLLKN
jgi:hypothetical protein